MEPAEALAEELQKRQTLARGAAQNGCRVVLFRASDPRNCPDQNQQQMQKWTKARLSVVCSVGMQLASQYAVSQ
jgi:hypothetical protein